MGTLVKRCFSGLVFLVAMVGCSMFPYTFAVAIVFSISVMMLEYFNITMGKGFFAEKIISIITAVSLFILLFLFLGYGLDSRYLLLAFLPLIINFILLMFRKNAQEEHIKSFGLFFPLIYIALPIATSNFLVFDGNGNYSAKIFLSIFILIWMNDIGAYIFGMAFGQKEGRKRLFPSLSPKKSWAGVIGGVLLAIISAIIMYILGWMEFSMLHCLAITLIVVVFSTFGDLFESLIKRNCGVKDAGNIMPGHGGLLDRFDGALFVIPVVVIYLKIFLLI